MRAAEWEARKATAVAQMERLQARLNLVNGDIGNLRMQVQEIQTAMLKLSGQIELYDQLLAELETKGQKAEKT